MWIGNLVQGGDGDSHALPWRFRWGGVADGEKLGFENYGGNIF